MSAAFTPGPWLLGDYDLARNGWSIGARGQTIAVGTYLGGTDGTFKAELQYVAADSEGRVIGVHRNTGKRNGKTLDTMCCITAVLKDGKIQSGKEHFFDLYNWDQFWA